MKDNAKVLWLQLGLKLLSAIESLMPAALIMWNQYLQKKSSDLRVSLEASKAELAIHKNEVAIREKYANQDRRNLLDRFLKRAIIRPGIRETDKDAPPD